MSLTGDAERAPSESHRARGVQFLAHIIALGQDQRRTRIANRIDDVLADSPRSRLSSIDNVSVVDENYRLVNGPTVIDLPDL